MWLQVAARYKIPAAARVIRLCHRGTRLENESSTLTRRVDLRLARAVESYANKLYVNKAVTVCVTVSDRVSPCKIAPFARVPDTTSLPR